jgi:hypothetical protein
VKALGRGRLGTVSFHQENILEESLETEVDRILGRPRYVRRRRVKRKETGVYCSRCRSHQRQDFRRNGHYLRQLALQWGRVNVQVPQVKCRCGGYVHLKYQTLRPRKRIWDDLALEIQAEYGRGLSYRQIKMDLDRRLRSSVGLRTLNQQVLPLGSAEGAFPLLRQGEVPPVVRVDGIWITVMFAISRLNWIVRQLIPIAPVSFAQRLAFGRLRTKPKPVCSMRLSGWEKQLNRLCGTIGASYKQIRI